MGTTNNPDNRYLPHITNCAGTGIRLAANFANNKSAATHDTFRVNKVNDQAQHTDS